MSGLTSLSAKKVTVDWTNLKEIHGNIHDATMFNILLGFFCKNVTEFEIDVDYIKFITDFNTSIASYIGEEYEIYKVNLIFTKVQKLNELQKIEKYFSADMDNGDKVVKGNLCDLLLYNSQIPCLSH
uniref:Exonuclease domain-containing protein n=1 Tax=Rhabditophanes sp. KR3021 TaxID=114890 RepID=A0AC35UFJ5_9BILA